MTDDLTIYLVENETNVSNKISKALSNAGFVSRVLPGDFVHIQAFAQANSQPALFLLGPSCYRTWSFSDYVDVLIALHHYGVIVVLDMAHAQAFDAVLEFSEHDKLDCVFTPLRMPEVIARLHFSVKRHYSEIYESHTLIDGPFELTRYPNVIHVGNEIVALTAKEFDVAEMLFKHRDNIVSRYTLESTIWHQPDDVISRTVDTHVARIRKKLKLDGQTGYELTNVYGYGYQISLVRRSS